MIAAQFQHLSAWSRYGIIIHQCTPPNNWQIFQPHIVRAVQLHRFTEQQDLGAAAQLEHNKPPS